MLRIGDKEYRNLQEQVRQNQSDIKYLLEEGAALNEFGIKVVGVIATANELPDPTTYQGEFGDAYAVGTAAPYTLYIFTRQVSGQTGSWWFNIGLFPAPSTVPGPIGPQGIQGQQGIRGSLWYSQTGAPTNTVGVNPGDQALNGSNGDVYQFVNGAWQLTGNIRGPQGIQGIRGPQGIQGIQGPVGPQGPKGDQGQFIQILGTLDSTSQLPLPTSVPRSAAYLIPEDGVNHIYLIVGEETLEWVDAGAFAGGTNVIIGGASQNEIDISNVSEISKSYQIAENTQVSTNGSEITFSNLQVVGQNVKGEQLEGTATIELPIASSDEIALSVETNTIQAKLTDAVWNRVANEVSGATPVEVQINAPSTSTNGQLTAEQLQTLQSNAGAYLMFNNEIYRLQDEQHESGYLVYSHLGFENTTQKYVIKCITITVSTRGWVLTTREVANAADLAKYLLLSGGVMTGPIQFTAYGPDALQCLGTDIILVPSIEYNSISPSSYNEDFYKAYLKWLCRNYPGKQSKIFIGRVVPNSAGYAITYIYNTSDVNEEGFPRYSSGCAQHLSVALDVYATDEFNWMFNSLNPNVLRQDGLNAMTGTLNLALDMYEPTNPGMACHNSMLAQVGAIAFNDTAGDLREGIAFPRQNDGDFVNGLFDGIYAVDGKLYFERGAKGLKQVGFVPGEVLEVNVKKYYKHILHYKIGASSQLDWVIYNTDSTPITIDIMKTMNMNELLCALGTRVYTPSASTSLYYPRYFHVTSNQLQIAGSTFSSSSITSTILSNNNLTDTVTEL